MLHYIKNKLISLSGVRSNSVLIDSKMKNPQNPKKLSIDSKKKALEQEALMHTFKKAISPLSFAEDDTHTIRKNKSALRNHADQSKMELDEVSDINDNASDRSTSWLLENIPPENFTFSCLLPQKDIRKSKKRQEASEL